MYSVAMERVKFTLVALNLLLIYICVPMGDAVAYFPQEARNQFQFLPPQFQSFYRNAIPHGYFMTREHMMPQEQMVTQNLQPILHTNAVNPRDPPTVQEIPLESLNYTVSGTPRLAEEGDFRAAKSGYEYPAHAPSTYPQAPSASYNYSPHAPNYSPAAPAAPEYVPPAHHPESKFPIFKPDLTSLIKPVSTKVATKLSGLIGLVLSLLTGTASDDLEMKGFKDIVINGIVKPLLIAKGGIKSLISKMTIPLISLLLINLEVLITVWWLWEECNEPLKPNYEYTKPTNTPSYNSYR